MSNAVDDDLDAEFLNLLQDVDEATKNLPPAQPAPPPAPPAVKQPRAAQRVTIRSEATVRAAATVVPSWQQGLLERDRQELKEANKMRREADAITGVAEAAARSAGTGADGNAPKGEWMWTDGRWEWKTFGGASSAPRLQPAAADAAPAGGQQRAKSNKRTAAGEVWVDASLHEWPDNDFRVHVSDLAPDATDAELVDAFRRYASFNMARVVKDRRSGKCRGYGFVSFASGADMVAALREMNGKYVGSRPVKLKKSNWQKRNLSGAKRKELKAFRTIGKT